MQRLVFLVKDKTHSMKSGLESSEISANEWLSLNQFVHELKQMDFPCMSVYYTSGKEKEIISLLKETKRNEYFEKIESEIEKKILDFKKQKKSIGNYVKTICIFGWVKNKKIIIREIGISKKLPYIYMAGKKPYLKPFQDVLKTNYKVLLVTIDQKSARIQKFYGSQIIQESKLRINLQGRHKKGGQSQGRFLRARQTQIHVFFKKIASKLRSMDDDVELILLGGPGPAKTEFFDELDLELIQKCRFVETLTFSTSLQKIYQKIISHLYQHRKRHVAEIIQKYEKQVKEGLTAKRNPVIFKALELGAVDTLIVSANYHTHPRFRNIMKMLQMAKNTSAVIEFAVSPRIIKRLDIDDSVLALLRYKIR